MADSSGRPIFDALPEPPRKPAGDTKAVNRSCVACGGYHGSVGRERLCLESKVRQLRALLAART